MHNLIPKNDVTEPKARYSNNQLHCKQIKSQFQALANHSFRKLLSFNLVTAF